MQRLVDCFKRGPKQNHPVVGHIGIEFAMGALYMVQLEYSPEKGYHVRAKAAAAYNISREALLSQPKRLRALIKPLLKLHKFKGRQFVTALPISNVTIMPIAFSAQPSQDGNEALIQVLNERIEGDLDEYVIDYTEVRTQGDTQERLALVALSKKDDVIAFLESCRLAGACVEELEIGPTAIHRLVSSQFDPNDIQNTMVINFGQEKSYFTVISGRRLMLDKQIDFGENAVLKKISDSLEVTREEARVLLSEHGISSSQQHESEAQNEASEVTKTLLEIVKPTFVRLRDTIHQSLLYVSSLMQGQRIDRIYITGSVAHWQGADMLLDELIQVPVSQFPDPACFLNIHNQIESDNQYESASEWAVATGLALRGLNK